MSAARVAATDPTTSLSTNQDLDPQRLRQAFGVFPSGVVAVAAQVDGVLVGLAASSFTSVSIEPPLVSFSVATASKTWPTLRRAEHVGVTVLAEHHGALCRQLAGPVDRRFDGVPVGIADTGAVTLDEGLVRYDCSIYREMGAGDHTIVLLQLHTVDQAENETLDDGRPLVFHRSAFGRLDR